MSGSPSSRPLPSARSAIHHAALLPTPYCAFSHSRRALWVGGPDFCTSATHSSMSRPVFALSVSTQFWIILMPGCTSYGDLAALVGMGSLLGASSWKRESAGTFGGLILPDGTVARKISCRLRLSVLCKAA